MREVKIIEYCDICWGESNIKRESVENYNVTVGSAKPRAIALCGLHLESFTNLFRLIDEYGTREPTRNAAKRPRQKPGSQVAIPPQTKPRARSSTTPEPEAHFYCSCGKKFAKQTSLNRHVGAMLLRDPGQHKGVIK